MAVALGPRRLLPRSGPIGIRPRRAATTASTRRSCAVISAARFHADTLPTLHRKQADRHLLVAARRLRCWGCACGCDPLHRTVDPDPARGRSGIHCLQLHGAAPRGAPPPDLRSKRRPAMEQALGVLSPFPAASPPVSSRGGTSIITPSSARIPPIEAASPVAEAEPTLVQAAVLHAGNVSHLFSRGAKENGDVSRTAAGHDPVASAGLYCRSPPGAGSDLEWAVRVARRRCAPTSSRCSSCSRLPSRSIVSAALRHRSRRSRQ